MSETCAICEQPIDEHEPRATATAYVSEGYEGAVRESQLPTHYVDDDDACSALMTRQALQDDRPVTSLAGCVRALVKRVAALEARR